MVDSCHTLLSLRLSSRRVFALLTSGNHYADMGSENGPTGYCSLTWNLKQVIQKNPKKQKKNKGNRRALVEQVQRRPRGGVRRSALRLWEPTRPWLCAPFLLPLPLLSPFLWPCCFCVLLNSPLQSSLLASDSLRFPYLQ